MTYDDVMEENPTITRQQAERECRRHDASVEEMVADLGDHAEYEGRTFLGWLGY